MMTPPAANLCKRGAPLAGWTPDCQDGARWYERGRRFAALDRVERFLLPHARAAAAKAAADFAANTIPADEYLNQLGDEAETACLHRDALVRHRRAMLDLNTVVGVRLLP